VLGFFTSHTNWDLLHPHPQASVFFPLVGGEGAHSLAEEGAGGLQFGRDTDTLVFSGSGHTVLGLQAPAFLE
jgi:hypothetical protein